MVIATKSSGVGGKWLDKKSLKGGEKAKLKSEATEQPSQQGGTQWVAKLLVQGQPEALNVSINKPSKNALIDAFGEETADWVDKVLTLQVEKTVVSGKRGIAMYLVPEGFEVSEDNDGYIVIKKIGSADVEMEGEMNGPKDTINPDDIPF